MREEKIHKIEVHVAGICFDNNKVLIAKRTAARKFYPNLWECGGGQVRAGEDFKEAVKRQLSQEFGIIVEPIKVLGVYDIIAPELEQKKIPGVKFVCRMVGSMNGKEPRISKEHSECRWQPVDQLNGLEFILGLKEDIRLAYSIYQGMK